MSYATLMVYVDVEGKPDGRVSVAADLARRFDAHLIGIASGASISAALGEDAPNEAVAETPHLRDMKALLDQKGTGVSRSDRDERPARGMVVGRGSSGRCGRTRGAGSRSRHHRQCPRDPGSVSRSRSRQ